MSNYSALDNDLYNFTTHQAIHHNYPDVDVLYRYKCRNPEALKNVDTGVFANKVMYEIDRFCNTRFNTSDLHYLSNISFLKPDYIAFLEDFTFKRRYIDFKTKSDGFDISIKGPWVQTRLMDVPLMYIISETYSNMMGLSFNMKLEGLKKLEENLKDVNFYFAEFGTRRRASYDYQYNVMEKLVRLVPKWLVGTSNVLLSKLFNIKPIGTMDHSWLQAHQALFRVSDSQKAALQTWADEYRGDLGIALSDVVGFDAFLRDFDKYFAKLFDGCRHDSGDPVKWAFKLINHYKKLGIDPKTKSAVFSDGLDFETANEIESYLDGEIKTSYGIGTWLTNNLDFTPLQIVIKMVECNGKPVAKISDSPGKGMCEDDSYLEYLKSTFEIGR